MDDATTADTQMVTQGPKAKRGGRIRTMIALSFGYFIDQGEAQAMSVLFPTLQALWGLSYTQLGLIGTIRNILQSVTAPFWGYAADRYPRKNGTGIGGLWTLLCSFSQNFGQLLILRAISGIGLGCLMPATFSLISDSYPPSKRGAPWASSKGWVCWASSSAPWAWAC
jgi:MFS family permease